VGYGVWGRGEAHLHDALERGQYEVADGLRVLGACGHTLEADAEGGLLQREAKAAADDGSAQARLEQRLLQGGSCLVRVGLGLGLGLGLRLRLGFGLGWRWLPSRAAGR
jgi:hypothetical protein